MQAALNYVGLVLVWSFFFSLWYLPLRYLTLRHATTLWHELGLWLFWISVTAVLSQTLTSDGTVFGLGFSLRHLKERNLYSFVPFRILRRIAGISDPGERFSFALVNVPGNILIFAPVGFFARWAFGCSALRATLYGAALSLFVELGQVFLPRTTDIDDLIMNTLGALLGALLWAALTRLLRGGEKHG